MFIMYIFVIFILFIILIVAVIFERKNLAEYQEYMHKLTESNQMNMRSFMENMENGNGRDFLSEKYSVTGCFVLKNMTKCKSYVGQSSNILQRTLQVINGSAVPALYADIANGDEFDIIFVPLSTSKHENVSNLQLELMNFYHSLDPSGQTGYNLRRPSGTSK